MEIEDIIMHSECKGADVIMKTTKTEYKNYTDYYCGRERTPCGFYRTNAYGNCCLGYLVDDLIRQQLK